MATIEFFEKNGCLNNARQKQLLEASGHTLITRNILTYPWTPKMLEDFFQSKSIIECFNPASPRIKSGEVVPSKVSVTEAIELMLSDPLLIRRPLMNIDGHLEVGFDQKKLHAWIGLESSLSDPESCQK
ncbi:ArsC/Spx/MgsR family protein [Ferrovum myxofaciens]|jgi:nitrogenase-associated protein|uniref:ArsC family protein n=1 Tax=Ferrovum myxofaciens TaxID=416213 RepID=A0A8F3IKA8_9PROT|nr:ArsC/Spx/MgsR family protein [Ferrovum myxofaciens]KXW57754.1 ArsC family protein [Ferrovum myxofaciens]MBU6995638.1 hypothetical protein [Ferrovum myxofaciens]QKE39581.1 MAG: hypothetical protein HO273_13350 [Ferrovum myxofaciens]QWY74867.1 MAG: hypothetical protein JVY19_13905 [Ferrovum myxofaciens]QWY77616.1 MAG: hypothetical protein JZL65_00565 [Ferrovum myxofaciens]